MPHQLLRQIHNPLPHIGREHLTDQSQVLRRHPLFAVLAQNKLEVAEALQGATIEVPTLDGTKRIKIPQGTKHGTIQRLRGEGAPKRGKKGRGDIRYRLEIEMPQKLTSEQREAVEKLDEALNGDDPRAELLRKAGR